MLKRVLILVLAVASLAAGPGPEARRAQVLAATADAVDGLMAQIMAQPLTQKLTVGQLLEQTNVQAMLRGTLERAEQIGGPRWIDEHTCQVKLEISGIRVAAAISQIAASHPEKITVPAQVVQYHLRSWDAKTFAATGSSIGAGHVAELVPEADAWGRVPDDARRIAVLAARDDAITRVMDSIKPVKLVETQTIGEALNVAPATLAVPLERYLAQRPVTGVTYRDDLTVELRISVLPGEFFDVFQSTARTVETVSLPEDEAGWERVRADFVSRLGPVVGIGTVPTASTQPGDRPRPLMPAMGRVDRAPAWVSRQIDAMGTAETTSNNLRARELARAAALSDLEGQILALKLTGDRTIAQAAQEDPRVREALSRALSRARTYKSVYDPSGLMTVHVSLELRYVWDELQQI